LEISTGEVFALLAVEMDLLWGMAAVQDVPVDEIFPTGLETLIGTEVFWGLEWLFEPGDAVNHINRRLCPLQDLPPINAFSADCRVV
jgi:hypothetical protein